MVWAESSSVFSALLDEPDADFPNVAAEVDQTIAAADETHESSSAPAAASAAAATDPTAAAAAVAAHVQLSIALSSVSH